MLADYHSLTTATSFDHGKTTFNFRIAEDTFEMARTLLASGVDPSKICLFAQSHVSAQMELTWILSCLGPQHWLNLMIQYKEKADINSSVGLYTYPLLMAADIMAYRANYVPVGVDQTQHLELVNKLI